MEKPKLKLATSDEKPRSKIKRMVVIYTADGEEHTFDMAFWKLYKANDWVELRKNDKTEIMVFYYANVMKIWQYKTSTLKSSTVLTGEKGA